MPGEIFVVAEHLEGRLDPVSFEVAAFAGELAEAVGADITGLVLARPAKALADEFAEKSGLAVLAVEGEGLGAYNAEAYLCVLAGLISERKPSYVLVPHTAIGWDFAPRLAVRVGGSCSTGVAGFGGSPPSFVRQVCGGKIVTEVCGFEGTTAVVTIMPGAIKPTVPDHTGSVEVVQMPADSRGTRTLGYVKAPRGELDLSKAEVVVAAGRGVGDPEKLDVIRELAACFDHSAVAASRPVCDAGWLPLEHQVGMTGQSASPRLYIACGISGAIQHSVGMSGSELIVAVNTDPKAMIFNIAHLGVVRDLHEFLPILIQKIQGPGES